MFGFIATLVFAISTPLYAQTVEWTRFFGGDRNQVGNSTIQTIDGGYLMVGSTTGYQSNPKAVESGYLVKLDATGRVQWEKSMGSHLETRYHHVFANSDNSYTVIGWARVDSDGAKNTSDYLLTRIDSVGGLISETTFGSPLDEYFSKAIRTADNNFVIVGYDTSSMARAYMRTVVYKVDSTGDVLWNRTYGSATIQRPEDVKEVNGNGYIITGYMLGVPAIQNDVCLLRIAGNGDSLWMRNYAAAANENGVYVIPSSDGFLVAGTKDENRDSFGYYVKVNADGVFQSSRSHTYPDIYIRYRDGITFDDGTTMLLGIIGRSSGNWRMVLNTISSEGDTLSTVTLDTESDTADYRPRDLYRLPDGGFLITGYDEGETTQAYVTKISAPPASALDNFRWIRKLDLY